MNTDAGRLSPCRPVKAGLTSGFIVFLAPPHPIVSLPVLTGPLANGLQKGGHTNINNA